ncbi:hypothetical protein EON63_11965 [archaeon]|nr:MAG: hypothetical protein EON63_11965 [archaeon]
MEEFHAMDFPSKLARHDEKLNKIQFDLNDLTATLTTTVFGEMKSMNLKINVLQEGVNVHLPALINNNAVQIQVGRVWV